MIVSFRELIKFRFKVRVGVKNADGNVSEMNWKWDVDFMSYMDLESLIQSEGYKNIKCLWYWDPAYRFSRGLRSLNNDQDVLQFSKDVIVYDVIDVYVEHNVKMLDIVDDSELDANIDGDSDDDV